MALLLQVTELREQSFQQVGFCTQMGSALCTLLWGVSNREETVKSILGMVSAGEAAGNRSVPGGCSERVLEGGVIL